MPDVSTNDDKPANSKDRLLSRREWIAAGASVLLGGAVLGSQAFQDDGLKLAMDSATAPCPPRRTPPPNLVVYLADSLRGDHLGCYGHGIDTSPQIDAFSRESLVFQQCLSQASWTKPSIGALFTGVVPSVHQAGLSQWNVAEIGKLPVQILRPNLTTLAECLQASGYHTAYFACNSHVQKEFGFARGFDEYFFQESWAREDQAAKVIAWLKAGPPEPFFLFVHQIDPHDPYCPDARDFVRLFGTRLESTSRLLPGNDRALLEPLYPSGGPARACDDYRAELKALSQHGRAYLARRYDAEIRGVDRAFGRIHSALATGSLLDRTAVAITGDHGEAFGEHDLFFHANSLFTEEIRVPLVLRLPGGAQRGAVPWPVGLFDLYPTFLTLAGVEIPHYIQARTLVHADGELARYRNRALWADFDCAQTDLERWESAMMVGPWKVHRRAISGDLAVYNRDIDPEERHNLLLKGSPQHDEAHQWVRLFHERRSHHTRLAKAFGDPAWSNATSDYREQVEALGYL